MSERAELRPAVEQEGSPSRLIALYGVNNLGKTTQLDLLVEHFEGKSKPVVHQKFPNYESPSGQIVNQVLRHGREASAEEFQLWNAVNQNQEQEGITLRLESGEIIVAEGYWGETLAWGLGSDVPRDALDAMTAGLRIPDLAILLHGNRFKEAAESGHLHETNDDLTERVQGHHLDLAEEFGWHKVNANQPIETVHAAILKIMQNKT